MAVRILNVILATLMTPWRFHQSEGLLETSAMTCTIDKILQDAKTLLERLKDHDNAAESLIEQSSSLHKHVEAMKEVGTTLPEKYQEDLAEIKDTSKYKPHVLLCQENTQIRDLQHENKELWLSLEEHQYALELIMSKYRRQMLQLMANKKPVPTEPVLGAHEAYSSEIESFIDRICAMGEVMRKAIQVDEEQAYSIQERLAQLELENKELRAILSVSKESLHSSKNESEWNSLEKSQ
ncbi:suppressor of IKBKE 1 isoform X2 [Rhinoderma darwinii]|uniref:suppressor of IKBKE 1 isoform X2 n=2 Tax=Rhinoderma darwinii TaxID=43563 RepID=UPI003F673D06